MLLASPSGEAAAKADPVFLGLTQLELQLDKNHIGVGFRLLISPHVWPKLSSVNVSM